MTISLSKHIWSSLLIHRLLLTYNPPFILHATYFLYQFRLPDSFCLRIFLIAFYLLLSLLFALHLFHFHRLFYILIYIPIYHLPYPKALTTSDRSRHSLQSANTSQSRRRFAHSSQTYQRSFALFAISSETLYNSFRHYHRLLHHSNLQVAILAIAETSLIAFTKAIFFGLKKEC